MNDFATSTWKRIPSLFFQPNGHIACSKGSLIQLAARAQPQSSLEANFLVQLLIGAVLLVLLVITVSLLINRIRMNAQLGTLVDNLEERVQERTRALEASAEISRRLTTILDLDELLQQVVVSIQHAFGYYQVHIYLIDENSDELVYREGTGEAGQQLKAIHHKLQPGKGIVGTTAGNGEAVLADNMDDIPHFVDNPILSNIRSELAVPVRRSDSVLGVLDVQSKKVNDFDENDLVLMQSIADQVAVAIQNARLYHQLEKQTLEAEFAREASERASRAKSEFMANMSHEFRTPLNGILGYAQILRRDSRLTDAQRDGLNAIYESGIHLVNLVNDVLDLSKIEAQKMDLYEIDFNFSNFLQGIVELVQVQAKREGLDFLFQRLTPLPHGVRADDKRLRQVLTNLLGNAVKFTDQGKVVLRVGVVDGGDTQGTARARFEVEDTGIGIQADQLEKVFMPFEQVGERGFDTEGTGLGLAISRQLVEMMGGKLHVKSEAGRGSTFWFEIDLKQAQSEVQADHIAPRLIWDEKLAEQPLAPPPPEEIQILFDLAMKGDMVGLENRAAHLEQMGEENRPFANQLRQLAKNFEDEQILTLVESYMEED